MDSPAPSPAAVSPKKALKQSVAKIVPDPEKAGLAIRALRSALKSRLEPDMLPITLASLGFNDATLVELKRAYEAVMRMSGDGAKE